jgi:DNA repair protein RadA/Sms
MVEVPNPSALFLSTTNPDAPTAPASGCAVSAIVEGSRGMLCEIQAIASKTTGAASPTGATFPPKHRQNGLDMDRFALLLAVLAKRARLPISTMDVFVNVVGGLRVREPASDLAVVTAVASAVHDVAWPKETCFVGEVGLAGEIRAVPHLDVRLREIAKLGMKRVYLPWLPKYAALVGQPGQAVAASHLFTSLPNTLSVVPCQTLDQV